MKPWLRRRKLPAGIAIEQIAAALQALDTARFSVSGIARIKGQDHPVRGEGTTDFRRRIESRQLMVDGTQLEHLDVGNDTFHKLPAHRQQATGKVWVWERRCPHGDYWAELIEAVRHIASCTGSVDEVLAAEPVRRYSFLIRPRRASFLTRLLGREDPFVRRFRAHLLAHGSDLIELDVWLARDSTVRRMRMHGTASELALLEGRTSTVTMTQDLSDFGADVGLAAPPAELVLGHPDEQPAR